MSSVVHSASGQVLHQTRTFQLDYGRSPRYKPSGRFRGYLYDDTLSKAECVCGWVAYGEHRPAARAAARRHRLAAALLPTWRSGAASTMGPRQYNADALALHIDEASGLAAWAVADGIGDTPESQQAASLAASSAVAAAAGGDAVRGVLAAAEEVLEYQCGDAVIVVAAARPPAAGGGYDIAWVGDCRAWAWDGATLTQLTTDHTVGELYRQSPHLELRELAGHHDHVVTRSVATAEPDTIGSVRTGAPARLLLTSDGIHKPVPAGSITRAAGMFGDPRALAHKLTVAARFHRGRDNATALIVDPVIDTICLTAGAVAGER